MELSVNGRQRRAARTAANPAPQAGKKPTGTAAAPRRAGNDRATWSQAALSFLQELNRQDMEKQRKLLEAKQKGSSELDALAKSMKVMEQCRKIASRIMKGDKVPPQDERFLMEADPDGYKLALACRVPKEKPKEWDSGLEDEEEESGSAQEAETGGETAEAPDSGGETAAC